MSPFSANEMEDLRSYVGGLLAAEIAVQLSSWNNALFFLLLLEKYNMKKQQAVNT